MLLRQGKCTGALYSTPLIFIDASVKGEGLDDPIDLTLTEATVSK